MWAVGHLALGYLTGKGVSKAIKEDANIPLLFFTSIIPDIDLLIPTLVHRGPTHSLVIYTMIFIPLYLIIGKKVVIYFVSLSSHTLLGDLLFTGGAIGGQILWPLNSTGYSGVALPMSYDVPLEWLFFLSSIVMMLSFRDLNKIFKPHPVNLLLTIPIFTIILPVFFSFPTGVPSTLFIPHLVFLAIILFSILTDLKKVYKGLACAKTISHKSKTMSN